MPKKLTKKEIKDQITANLVAAKLKSGNSPIIEWLIKERNNYPTLHYIHVEFCGSGDSGEITSVAYRDHNAKDIEPGATYINDCLYDLIEKNITCDWCNNEGGGGEFDIDLLTMEIEFSSYYHEQVTHDCDSKTFEV
jgi:hypothetical protein